MKKVCIVVERTRESMKILAGMEEFVELDASDSGAEPQASAASARIFNIIGKLVTVIASTHRLRLRARDMSRILLILFEINDRSPHCRL
ncbi:MAG: hypothetical protein P4L81_07115 [Candidatus Pacebacteria bacterium]|nr:hypothetical protein [Candidatus Paceibacterota bacterium]